MGLSGTAFGRINIHIVDFTANLALVLVIDFHDLYLFLAVCSKFLLILGHQFWLDAQLAHFLRLFHPDDHVVEVEVGLDLDALKSLEDVAVLFPIQVKRVLRRIFCLQFVNYIQQDLPTYEAMTCMRSPPSATIFWKR